MEQEKLVMIIAILLFINLVVSSWTLTRSMMRPLKMEGYDERRLKDGGTKGGKRPD